MTVAYFFKETHKTTEKFHINLLEGIKDVRNAFQIKQLRHFYLMYMFWILGWGIAFQWYSPVAIQKFHTSPVMVNWGLFVVGVTWMFGGYTLNNVLIKRWHPRPLIVIGNALTTLCVLGMAFSPSFYLFATFFGIGCIPSAFAWPNILNLISTHAPQGIQGKIMGISQSFQSLGFIFATVFGGILAGMSLKSIYYFATFFLFIGFILIFLKHNHIKKYSL